MGWTNVLGDLRGMGRSGWRHALSPYGHRLSCGGYVRHDTPGPTDSHLNISSPFSPLNLLNFHVSHPKHLESLNTLNTQSIKLEKQPESTNHINSRHATTQPTRIQPLFFKNFNVHHSINSKFAESNKFVCKWNNILHKDLTYIERDTPTISRRRTSAILNILASFSPLSSFILFSLISKPKLIF